MSDPDDEKAGPQVVSGGPPGRPAEPTPANEEVEQRRAAEHGDNDAADTKSTDDR